MIERIKTELAGALIALDYDGTLSPIVADPMQARPVDGVVETLTRLARRGAQVAVVTGRDARTVLELGGLHDVPGLLVSGLHGAESWRDGELTTRDEPPGLEVLRRLLPPMLPPDVWLEDKRLSLVVHVRRAADPLDALQRLTEVVPPLAAEHGIEAHPGKLVIELRIPDLSKATALDRLLTETTTAAFFAGDDLGDLPAVRAVQDWTARTGRPALTVAVGEVAELRDAADAALAEPAELAELLAELAR
ncbi:MAG TPA: trehalose-phosphatase [Jatrophihabitans sp.]|nr:trehalose-phosphatase [Jatrophihabitans sp.]